MKIIDIPALVRALADVYGPAAEGPDVNSPHTLLAAMLAEVLDVHRHDLMRWDADKARAIDVDDVAEAEFAICQSCGRIDREYFWCWTMRQLYVALASATDQPDQPETWKGWHDMGEAIRRARAAYPAPVATAVIRALNNPAFTLGYRTSLLDAVITCTQAVPEQPIPAERGN